mgnify:CR=1 FL=1
MGTEKAHDIYLGIERYLQENGVEILFGWECRNLILENDVCKGVTISDQRQDMEIHARHTVVATGRRGLRILQALDMGVRAEVQVNPVGVMDGFLGQVRADEGGQVPAHLIAEGQLPVGI